MERDTAQLLGRGRVLARLTEWDIGALIRDDAQPVVSELFTDAVRHTAGDRAGCELRATDARPRPEIADQGHAPARPGVRHSTADGEGGRGLLLVGAPAEEWGIRPGSGGRGTRSRRSPAFGSAR